MLDLIQMWLDRGRRYMTTKEKPIILTFHGPLPNNQIRYEDRTRGGVPGCSVLDKSVSLNIKDLKNVRC